MYDIMSKTMVSMVPILLGEMNLNLFPTMA